MPVRPQLTHPAGAHVLCMVTPDHSALPDIINIKLVLWARKIGRIDRPILKAWVSSSGNGELCRKVKWRASLAVMCEEPISQLSPLEGHPAPEGAVRKHVFIFGNFFKKPGTWIEMNTCSLIRGNFLSRTEFSSHTLPPSSAVRTLNCADCQASSLTYIMDPDLERYQTSLSPYLRFDHLRTCKSRQLL